VPTKAQAQEEEDKEEEDKEEEEERRRFFVRSMSLRALWRLVRLWEGRREVVGSTGRREAGRGGGEWEGMCRTRHVSSLSLSLSLSLALSLFRSLALPLSRSLARSLFRSLSLSRSRSLTLDLSPRPPLFPPSPSFCLPPSFYLSLYRSFSHPREVWLQQQGSRNCSQQHVRPRKVL
jgi:hypothetical protein